MKIITLLCVSLALLLTSASGAEISREKRAEIDRMLRLTGMEKIMAQMKDQMLGALKTQVTQVPPEMWDRLGKKLDMAEFLDQIIALYDKYYTIEDLRAVNAFYSTPVGQKILQTLPQITQESMLIGQAWGQKAGRKALEEARAELDAEAKRNPKPTTPSVTLPAPDKK